MMEKKVATREKPEEEGREKREEERERDSVAKQD